MKVCYIEAQFPECKGNCYGSGKGTGSTTKAAISRAVADLLKCSIVRKKRITQITMKVTVNTKTEPKEEPKQTA